MWWRACLAAALFGGALADDVITVYVAGATGEVEIANGRYDLSSERHNGRQCYKKQHTSLWLCLDGHGLWNFQPRGFLGTSQGIMVSTQKHSETPLGSGPWRVWGEDAGAWMATSVRLDSQPGAGAAPSLDSRDMVLRQCVAGMLFGALVLGLLVLSLLSSTDIQIRSCAYRLLSTWVTFTISFLFVGAVWDLLCKQLLPAPFPRGLGLGYHISPGIKIVVSFFAFTLCFFIGNGVAWKCQYRRSRLMVVKTLNAHITACWGICTFTEIQYEVVFGAAGQFDGLFGEEATKRVLSFAVVVMAWYIFAIYRWASMGARQEILKEPPRWPWPPSSGPSVTSSGGGRDTGCLGPWQTRLAGEPEQPEWGRYCDEGEDEAAIVTIGFLLAQALMFYKTAELPGFRGHYTHQTDDRAVMFFTSSLLALFVAFFVILFVRSKYRSFGRSGKIVQHTCAMAVTWMLYRMSCWSTRNHFQNHRALALMVTGFGTAIACFIIVVVSDKVLDRLLGRKSVPDPAWAKLNEGGGTVSLAESCTRGVMCCMGLVMALPWQLNVEISVLTLVTSQEFLAKHLVLSRNLITILLAVAAVFPWRQTLLPKSEMREAALGEEIHHELIQLDRAENFMP